MADAVMDLHARHHRHVEVAVEFRERYWYPDDGGEVWVSGFHLVDEAGQLPRAATRRSSRRPG